MKILCVSDTHGETKRLHLALAKFGGIVDLILHSGDGAADMFKVSADLTAQGAKLPPIRVVRGNSDAAASLPDRLIIETAGKRLFLTHGHILAVHDDFARLILAAKAAKADIAVFGHTHDPFWEEIQGTLFLNPGSLSRPRRSPCPTFAVLSIPEDPEAWYGIDFYQVRKGMTGFVIEKTDIG
jgi:uncharacterized protein